MHTMTKIPVNMRQSLARVQLSTGGSSARRRTDRFDRYLLRFFLPDDKGNMMIN
jgi:hypothetical protein